MEIPCTIWANPAHEFSYIAHTLCSSCNESSPSVRVFPGQRAPRSSCLMVPHTTISRWVKQMRGAWTCIDPGVNIALEYNLSGVQ